MFVLTQTHAITYASMTTHLTETIQRNETVYNEKIYITDKNVKLKTITKI